MRTNDWELIAIAAELEDAIDMMITDTTWVLLRDLAFTSRQTPTYSGPKRLVRMLERFVSLGLAKASRHRVGSLDESATYQITELGRRALEAPRPRSTSRRDKLHASLWSHAKQGPVFGVPVMIAFAVAIDSAGGKVGRADTFTGLQRKIAAWGPKVRIVPGPPITQLPIGCVTDRVVGITTEWSGTNDRDRSGRALGNVL